MAQDHAKTDATDGENANWARRTVLKVSSAAAGVAALGGAGLAASQEDGTPTAAGNETGTETGDVDGADHFVADLVDPVFGYPLAADESDDVDVGTVVEAYTEEGEGDHEGFPIDPQAGEQVPMEFGFDPVGLQVEPGDLVEFADTAGEHTVTAFHEKFAIPQRPIPTRVPEGVPGFTSPPIVDGESWIYQFEERGVYDLLCLPHLQVGMVMRVVVYDPDADDIGDEAFAEPSAGELSPNAAAVLEAPELDPANVVEEGPVSWADLTVDVQTSEPPQAGAEAEGNVTGPSGNVTGDDNVTEAENATGIGNESDDNVTGE